MAAQKLVVDCSIPHGQEGHATMQPLSEKEKAQREKDTKHGNLREQKKATTPLDALAAVVEKAETVEDLKTAILAFARGGNG